MVNSNPAYKTDAIQEPEVVDKLLRCFAKMMICQSCITNFTNIMG